MQAARLRTLDEIWSQIARLSLVAGPDSTLAAQEAALIASKAVGEIWEAGFAQLRAVIDSGELPPNKHALVAALPRTWDDPESKYDAYINAARTELDIPPLPLVFRG